MGYISTLGYLGVSMEHHPSYGHVNKETIAGSRGAQYQWVGLREIYGKLAGFSHQIIVFF